jgi:hypothetical protein
MVLLQHSDCGTSHLTEQLVHERVKGAVEPNSEQTLKFRDEVVNFKISHGEDGVKEDLALLKSKGYLRKELINATVGFWLDTFTGVVKTVT